MSEEKINHPSYYGGDERYEVVKLLDDWHFGYGFAMGSAIKYIVRAGKKNADSEETDIKKAIWFLERAVGLDEPKNRPPMFHLSPSEAAKFHSLSEARSEALTSIARRDPESAIRFLKSAISK